jgi:hypothetical protein
MYLIYTKSETHGATDIAIRISRKNKRNAGDERPNPL